MQRVRDLFKQCLAVTLIKAQPGQQARIGRVYKLGAAVMFWQPADSFNLLVDELSQRYLGISKRSIIKALEEAVENLCENETLEASGEAPYGIESLADRVHAGAIETGLNMLLSELERMNDQHYLAFVPVQGIRVELDTFQIAGGTLHPSNSTEIKDRLKQTHIPQHMQADFLERYENCSAYFVCQERGDWRGAQESAYDRATKAIQLLRFYLTPDTLEEQRWYQRIRVVDEPEGSGYFVFLCPVASSDDEVVSGHLSEQSAPYRPHVLTGSEQILDSENLELLQRAVLYEGSGTGNIEARLQRAVRWFSYGVGVHALDQKFVGFAVALESLLTDQVTADPKRSWGGITQNLAERSAFLLERDVEARVQTAKEVRKLYGTRSQVVHGGHPAEPEQVEQMQELARNAILAFVSKGFPNWTAFEDWIKQCKYGTTDG